MFQTNCNVMYITITVAIKAAAAGGGLHYYGTAHTNLRQLTIDELYDGLRRGLGASRGQCANKY